MQKKTIPHSHTITDIPVPAAGDDEGRRSYMTRKLMAQKPDFLERFGLLLLFAVIAIVLTAAYFIKTTTEVKVKSSIVIIKQHGTICYLEAKLPARECQDIDAGIGIEINRSGQLLQQAGIFFSGILENISPPDADTFCTATIRFNQSPLLNQHFSEGIGLPLISTIVVKKKVRLLSQLYQNIFRPKVNHLKQS